VIDSPVSNGAQVIQAHPEVRSPRLSEMEIVGGEVPEAIYVDAVLYRPTFS